METENSVSSAVLGKFDPIDELPENFRSSWVFEYKKKQKFVSFLVNVDLPNLNMQQLRTALDLDDVDELIAWLAIVKNSMTPKSNGTK